MTTSPALKIGDRVKVAYPAYAPWLNGTGTVYFGHETEGEIVDAHPLDLDDDDEVPGFVVRATNSEGRVITQTVATASLTRLGDVETAYRPGDRVLILTDGPEPTLDAQARDHGLPFTLFVKDFTPGQEATVVRPYGEIPHFPAHGQALQVTWQAGGTTVTRWVRPSQVALAAPAPAEPADWSPEPGDVVDVRWSAFFPGENVSKVWDGPARVASRFVFRGQSYVSVVPFGGPFAGTTGAFPLAALAPIAE